MLTPEQLKSLLSDLESDRIERTTSTQHTDKFAQAICAFANEQEERVLSERRASLNMTFDVHPVPEACIADLTMRLFDEYRMQAIDAQALAANHRTTEEKLASLRCFDLRSMAPTVAGILLFGTDPTYYFPGAYVQ